MDTDSNNGFVEEVDESKPRVLFDYYTSRIVMSTYSRQLEKMESQQKLFTSLLIKMMRSKLVGNSTQGKQDAADPEKKALPLTQ